MRSVGSRRKNDTVEAPHRSLTVSMQAMCSKLGIQLLKTRHLYFGNVTSHVMIPPAPVALTTRLSRLMCSNVFHLSHKLMFTCPCCVSDGVYEDSTMACIRADALSGLSLRKFFKRQLLFSRSAQMAKGFPKFPQNDFNANHLSQSFLTAAALCLSYLFLLCPILILQFLLSFSINLVPVNRLATH